MITVVDIAETAILSKPILCPKCERGRIGFVPASSKVRKDTRGKSPPEILRDYLLSKCPKCGSSWSLVIE